ncbi:uncharacterized protein LOC112050903 isoform X2 [Bicyclus anynana]|uniref:Uncharacterized protein LOC112050903 isoform X2 n=1 Tax=Bicyclus anynana TaxID=110368 RepID=A0ABM3LPP5_BICAN|nr:uncharacterized protein LOC112050903 isoform X2 [Bicyclus anynana]
MDRGQNYGATRVWRCTWCLPRGFLDGAIAFEIPIEEFDVNPKATTPPPHLQRLLHPPPADIKLPDIREKLAEAEQRRLLILQQRAASAQKRAQRMTKSSKINDDFLGPEESKHGPNVVTISPEPGVCEDKNI